MSDSLERLREARFIEVIAADDEEIVGLWSKALDVWRLWSQAVEPYGCVQAAV